MLCMLPLFVEEAVAVAEADAAQCSEAGKGR